MKANMNRSFRHFGLIATSIVLIICIAIITGSTLSLFTSGTDEDINVNAAQVMVSSKIENLATYSMDQANAGAIFANGGEAVITAKDTETKKSGISLNRLTPGDRAEFDVVVYNHSNVNIAYQFAFNYDTNAFGEMLHVAITDNGASVDIEGNMSDFFYATGLDADANLEEGVAIHTFHVSVELDFNAGNEYQNLSETITFELPAIQANAATTNVASATHLQYTLDTFGKATLVGNIDLGNTPITVPAGEDVKINLNGYMLNANGVAITSSGNLTIVDETAVETVALVADADETVAAINGIVVNNGTLNVEGGKIAKIENAGTATIDTDVAVLENTGAVTIESGNFTAITNEGAMVIETATVAEGIVHTGESLVIKSGEFDGGIDAAEDANITISGGSFGDEIPTDSVIDGFYAQKLGDEYVIVANGTALMNDKATLKAALTDLVAKGETDIVIDACGKDVGGLYYAINSALVPAGVTVTIKNATVSELSYGNACNGTVIFENCYFNNYSGAYSIHFDEGSGSVEFNNCTLAGWCSFGGIKSVKMTDCEIVYNDHYGYVRFYQNATLTNCTINCDGLDVVDYTMTLIDCTIENGELTGNYGVFTETVTAEGFVLRTDVETGDVIFYLVPETFEGNEVVVPEGVTTIGGYAFASNTGIEKIVLASTVTTLADRAFRDTSASTVILNEGLTNISYQAFRNALNVTSVEIPSTVTTISKEAFQNSGITALTVPATVTTIEYGAMRDMKMLETVTLEGNADIPVYAFRACTNLKTVYINGDNVTFGENGTSRGMIFTNKENGDGSAITIYVKNATVKERLLAQDTAAKDYGGYKIVCNIVVTTTEELAAALANAEPGAVIVATGVTISAGQNQAEWLCVPAGVTLKGAIISASSSAYVTSTGLATNGNVVFEDCTFSGPGFGSLVIAAADATAPDMDFNNCTFYGQIFPNFYSKADGVATFNNCSFALSPSENIGLVNCMGGTHVFNQCTFNYNGGSTFGSNQYVRWNAVNSYSENYYTSVTLVGCTYINCATQTFQTISGHSTLVKK